MATIDPNGAMVRAGLLTPDGKVTDSARARIIEIHNEISKTGKVDLPFPCVPQIEPNSYYNPDLGDREKYSAWHDRWIDGTYRSILISANTPSNFAIPPIMDPTAVALKLGLNIDINKIKLPSVLASFAMPIPTIPDLLGITTKDIPKFLEKLISLKSEVKIPSLELPDFSVQIPNLNGTFSLGMIDMTPDASYRGFMFEMQLSFSKIFSDLVKKLISSPELFTTFDAMKIFELACQASSATMPSSKTEYSPTFNANRATMIKGQADAIAISAVGSIVGNGVVTNTMSEKMGYIKKPEESDVLPLDAEALLNNLVRLKKEGKKNLSIVLPAREVSYGDPFVIKYIHDLTDHLLEVFPKYVLEIGNLTGKKNHAGITDSPDSVWRFQPWTTNTHKGGSFDFAYPFRSTGTDPNGDFITGFDNKKPFTQQQKAVVREGEGLITANYGGYDFSNPYKGLADKSVDSLVEKYAWDVLYEIGRWTFDDYAPTLVNDDTFYYKGKPIKKFPIASFIIGDVISKYFLRWTGLNGLNWRKKANGIEYALGSTSYFGPQQKHNDHIHVTVLRTGPYDKLSKSMGPTYEIKSNLPERFDKNPFKSGTDYFNWEDVEIETDIFPGKKYKARR